MEELTEATRTSRTKQSVALGYEKFVYYLGHRGRFEGALPMFFSL